MAGRPSGPRGTAAGWNATRRAAERRSWNTSSSKLTRMSGSGNVASGSRFPAAASAARSGPWHYACHVTRYDTTRSYGQARRFDCSISGSGRPDANRNKARSPKARPRANCDAAPRGTARACLVIRRGIEPTVRTSSMRIVARPAGLEPAAPRLEVPRKEATGGSAKPLPLILLPFCQTPDHSRLPRAATHCQSFVSRLSPLETTALPIDAEPTGGPHGFRSP
jgi:hypothetical protein